MSLLGLLRHLADVERGWSRRVMAGQDAPPHFYSGSDRDGDWDGAVPDPGVTGTHAGSGPVSLREVLVHMVEEYARHNGQADLIQRIDDQTGE